MVFFVDILIKLGMKRKKKWAVEGKNFKPEFQNI